MLATRCYSKEGNQKWGEGGVPSLMSGLRDLGSNVWGRGQYSEVYGIMGNGHMGTPREQTE